MTPKEKQFSSLVSLRDSRSIELSFRNLPRRLPRPQNLDRKTNAMLGDSEIDALTADLDCLNDCQNQMQELLVRVCNMNSGTMNVAGVKAVAEALRSEFAVLGGESRLVDVQPLETINDSGDSVRASLGPALHIVKRPNVRPRVILCIHTDTVYPLNHDFQVCSEVSDGRINGPGVADAKGGIVVMLYALRALEQSRLAEKVGWEVILNPDEELGSPGSESFLKSRATEADFGMLFEPALPDGTMVSSRKGVGNFTFVVRGKAAHSGREFEKGRNAIVACAQMMNRIHQLNTDPEIILNVGRISGGGPLNIVPDLAIGRVNIRVSSVEQQATVKEKLNLLVEEFNSADGFSVKMTGRFTSPPKEISAEIASLQRLVERCGQALKIDVGWRATGGASDGNKFAAVGLPNIDTFGVRGGDIHSRNEFVLVDSLVPRAKLAALTLLSIASGA